MLFQLQCVQKMSEFFSSGSCLPGVDKSENNPSGINPLYLKYIMLLLPFLIHPTTQNLNLKILLMSRA